MPAPLVIIVGAGPAGVATALQLRRYGLVPRILDVTGDAGGLVECAHKIENYPALTGPVSGPAFCQLLRDQLRQHGIHVEQETVRKVTLANHSRRPSILTGRSDCEADAIVLAVGTSPKPLGLANEADFVGRQIFYDVRPLRRLKPDRVLIVGGGEAAFDSALSLVDAGASVTLVVRAKRPRALGRLVEDVARSPHIEFFYDRRVSGAIGAGSGIAVDTQGPEGSRRFCTAALLVCVGRESMVPLILPRADCIGSPELAAQGVFVVGDARRGSLGQAGIAIGDGIEAAMKIVGRKWEEGPQ